MYLCMIAVFAMWVCKYMWFIQEKKKKKEHQVFVILFIYFNKELEGGIRKKKLFASLQSLGCCPYNCILTQKFSLGQCQK